MEEEFKAVINYRIAAMNITWEYPRKSWQDQLDSYYNISYLTRPSKSGQNQLDVITSEMKYMYPGNYIVEEYYDFKQGMFNIRPKFEDPKEELMWKLKWA